MPDRTFFQSLNQQKVANLMIVLFLLCAFAGIILIALKFYFIFYQGKEEANLIEEANFIKLFVECFSGILIVIAWLTLMKETQKISGDPDWGLAWLAVAIMCWCLGDLMHILFQFHDAFSFEQERSISPVLHSITSRIISTFNSFCFLFSLHYLEFSEKSRWKKLRDRLEKIFTLKTTIIILCSIVLLTVILGILFKNNTSFYVFIPDLMLSFVTTAALWFFFTEYFEQRKIDYMGFFVTVVAVVIILVQLGHLIDQVYLNLFFMKEGAPILSMIYRPFLITLFLLVAFSSIRNEKEKQAILERRDMNHAIRGSLHILNHDIKGLSKQSKLKHTTENTFFLQDLQYRVKAIYDLHNLIHNEHSDQKINVEKYIINLIENAKYAFEYSDIKQQFVNINHLNINRSLLRKIGTVVTELIINATKVAITKKHESVSKGKEQEKLLAVNVANQNKKLQIAVSDNGVYEEELLNKTNTGHGLNLIKRIVTEDFGGSLQVTQNNWQGTTITIQIPLKNII